MAAVADDPDPGSISIAAFQEKVSERGRAVETFRVEGVVCAAIPKRNWIALQDGSAAVLLETPALDGAIRVGDHVAVVGRNCAVDQSRFVTQLGTAPTVDIDGIHHASTKAGIAYLHAGLQPVHLSWFNGPGEAALKLEYEGEGLPRQKIPDNALWRTLDAKGAGRERGLDFGAYVGNGWTSVSDFERSAPASTGVARNFDCTRRTRNENAGLVFNGYIEIPATGLYTFYLESDDGARFYAGNPLASCEVIALGRKSAPEVKILEEPLSNRDHSQWGAAEGLVMFAAQDGPSLNLDLGWRGELLHVTVVDGASLLSRHLVQRRIRVSGLCEPARSLDPTRTIRLTVPTPDLLEIAGASPSTQQMAAGIILSTAEQVRDLEPEEADRHLRAIIPGVVTWVSAQSLMLQDATGGVFVSSERGPDLPEIGELWEAEGITERGGFAPNIKASRIRFLGHASLPEPIRATWDQLMNGSLDMQYVEIQGVLTAATDSALTILTRGGNIKIRNHPVYPLPPMLSPAPRAAVYVGSVLRIRGALSVEPKGKTRRAVAGVIRLGSPQVSVEEFRPADPFSIAAKKAADLLLFDPRASAFQRTKLVGQIIHAQPGEYFMLDGETGVRLVPREALPLHAGDRVEAVGFPQLGGPSLILQEVEVRITGRAGLPKPALVASKDLLDRQHDATLVQVEARLLEDRTIRGERVLDLQAGPYRFMARGAAGQNTWSTLRPGSRLQLTGVYSWGSPDRGAKAPDGFELLLDDPKAIAVLQEGPWWTERRIVAVAAALAGGLGAAGFWITLLHRKVDERTAQWQKEIGERQLAEQRRAVEQERARVAQDLHDELGAGLTEMGILGALAKNPNVPAEEQQGYLNRLTESASVLVSGLDEIVWAINPQYDSLGSLATYYSFVAERFLNLAGIVCRLQVAENLPEISLDSHTRHSIFLAFKEALNNIVRHSAATEVRLKIEAAGSELVISIQDNGCGFSPSVHAPGCDGIAGMRQRLLQLAGECRLSSAPGQGTTVEYRLGFERSFHDQSCHR